MSSVVADTPVKRAILPTHLFARTHARVRHSLKVMSQAFGSMAGRMMTHPGQASSASRPGGLDGFCVLSQLGHEWCRAGGSSSRSSAQEPRFLHTLEVALQ
jgi:hypothetical protein